MPTIKKVHNWKYYNESLKKRGGLILSFDENYFSELYYRDKQKRGGKCIYSDKMYEYLLTIKVMLRFPWRATIGFAEALLKKAFPESDVHIPDYAHASRECSKLNLKIKPINLSEGNLEIAFDSTGVNVYNASEYHQRTYSKDALYRRGDKWKKIHVAIELNSMQVLSIAYTDSNVNDCEVVKEVSSKIKGKIKNVRADGAYDTEEFRKIIYEMGAQDLIPAAVTAKSQCELKHKPKCMKSHLAERDKMIKEIREYDDFKDGLKAWKINSGYHKRSKIEAFMRRLKQTFGFNLQHKTDSSRMNEIITKMNILNMMSSLGKAEYSS